MWQSAIWLIKHATTIPTNVIMHPIIITAEAATPLNALAIAANIKKIMHGTSRYTI